MKTLSTLALALAAAAGAAVIATPAAAQKKGEATQPAAWAPKLSKEERAALEPVQTALAAKDFATATAALPAAQAAANGADARYFVGQFQLQIGQGTNNTQMQAQGVDAMVASGGGDPADRALLLRNQGALAMQAGDNAKAEAAFTKLLELTPGDQEITSALAGLRGKQNPAQGLALLEQQIAAAKAAGQKAPESTYKLALKYAYEGRLGPQSARLSRELVEAYPTPINWRDALIIYREGAQLDEAGQLDLLRLMRASKSLTSEADYYRLANTLNQRGLPGETKAVIDEGLAARAFNANHPTFKPLGALAARRIAEDRAALPALEKKAMAAATGAAALTTGDVYYGYGDYAKAAALYRAALQKGSVDSNVVNTRLGMALALAGQKAEAEAAFKAVTGVRADLAGLWLLWLNQRG